MAKIKITLEGYRCERCEHEWIPRTKEYPIICPKCKSPYWDKPKTDRSEAAKTKKPMGNKDLKYV
ncbi:MAG TPA: hypothetical protein ENH85_06660 [Candidatus Scalindua sp.]|nr:hypothetical protein [Candidatus Scalindua sp.]